MRHQAVAIIIISTLSPPRVDAAVNVLTGLCFVLIWHTGTVAGGSASVGDAIELPQLKQQRRIKSMQVFRQPVQRCQRGDRVGICVTQLDAGLIERGLACSPGAVPTYQGALAVVSKVRFYPGDVRSQGKMHVIVGHHTGGEGTLAQGTCTRHSGFKVLNE